ncbi:MAG: hypothetical protein ACLGI8_07285 [Acidimicrobiia bacterium]
MDLAQLRRNALSLWLRGARLPLTAVERFAAPREAPASWPPAIAFEKLEATVKDAVGRATGDDVLVGLANLQRTEVAKREEALAKRAAAEQTRTETREDAREAEAELARERKAVVERDRRRQEQIEAQERQAKSAVARRTSAKRANAEKAASARKKAVDAATQKAEAARLRKEERALEVKAAAVEAEGRVLDLDKAVRAKKAARTTG